MRQLINELLDLRLVSVKTFAINAALEACSDLTLSVPEVHGNLFSTLRVD